MNFWDRNNLKTKDDFYDVSPPTQPSLACSNQGSAALADDRAALLFPLDGSHARR